ncbi:hypothetical protein ANOM_002669 [Aspergillus nomiae NRRL 13137]|uniref:Uncharacterized protein n=1 Tax=Aspergillus nomiae NRRL (strain ATCC 15546 / NRRL 13137 / CBS 260.88 / M93) TaxID=1509407 RepID=A0A0L1JCA4_ASPN3|nr:uncharacterized protein ANOM_002669 [Aspergillus nomiae NRRL 13137]KNG89355.1 hypothetical protein ANOM_002669 [Aspergillus nomiae NRRL 13137]
MDVSSALATWLSLAATVVGLGSIVTRFGTIIDQADPFHSLRNVQHLGKWSQRQAYIPWYRVIKPPPVGPLITASLSDGFCGQMTIAVSRLPLTQPTGQAAWSVLLAVLHPTSSSTIRDAREKPKILAEGSTVKAECIVTVNPKSGVILVDDGWGNLPLHPLVKHKLTTCTIISRTTLMALFCITNARPTFRHSGSSGHRAAYATYCGQWRVKWPIGDLARVYFTAHDSHTLAKDVYPTTFDRRVDRCLQIFAGVIDAQMRTTFKCAFPGRKPSGRWVLKYAVKGFGGAHSGRHLYNMIGGNVTDVDFLFMKAVTVETEGLQDMPLLRLPNSHTADIDVSLYVPATEAAILNRALDCLPWSSLSWSIHRGLRDILVAFAKDRMDQWRGQLAETLRHVVERWPERLDTKGWNPQFVRDNMTDMAASAVLAGSGNSGDVVRVVTDIALTLWDGGVSALDETTFWRSSHPQSSASYLSPLVVIALVKCFVLEWSTDLDYQMYHDLPLEMYLG